MLAGLAAVKTEKVLIWEDDDAYASPFYIEAMCEMLNGFWLAGEDRAKYFNVRERRWSIHPNRHHASLCQTGLNGPEIKARAVEYLVRDIRPQTLDGGLWRRMGVPAHLKNLQPITTMCFGIKGMPGRGGLGDYGHQRIERYTPDPDLVVLRSWLGVENAELYRKFGEVLT